MANNKKEIELIKVKALKNIKYNNLILKIDDEFEINKDDQEELVSKKLIKVLEVQVTQEDTQQSNDTEDKK
ncbi:hypothetical protein [Clostridium sp. JS66]|uniref:DUF7210 family protein n=1 Tax=Clostridium sp. JS66 TaxID=3064705 RepID=UPI00298ECEAF|nr:hypothetical protein [Clostridium sp. JS66]WPC42954.1 hypothetical protein Q6H37_05635 [Clostridium sp. JS66]